MADIAGKTPPQTTIKDGNFTASSPNEGVTTKLEKKPDGSISYSSQVETPQEEAKDDDGLLSFFTDPVGFFRGNPKG